MSETDSPDFDDAEAADDAADMLALQVEVAALKEQVLRYAADAENARRRAEREANDARAFAIQKFARDLLGAADNLSRAMGAAPRDNLDPAVQSFLVGLEMTEKALQDAFERNGLKKVDPARGARFDPNLHQAVMEQPSDDIAAGGVLQVLQPGYELFGRIVRPAMVVVAARGSKAAEPAAEPMAQNPYAHPDDHAGEAVDTKA